MITAFYTAARIVLMLGGWLIALALAVDYIAAGAKWPIFVGLGAWWTLVCMLYIRREAEPPHAQSARNGVMRFD